MAAFGPPLGFPAAPSKRRPKFVQPLGSTSPDLLNAIRLEEVFWLVKKDGLSEIRRAQDDVQVKRYMEDGDKMGYLWKQGFFTGVDPA